MVAIIIIGSTCFGHVVVLVKNLLDGAWIDVDVVVLDQVFQAVVVVEDALIIVVPAQSITKYIVVGKHY